MTLKAIRKTPLYKALMCIPGVELMEIEKELQAVDVVGHRLGGVDFTQSQLDIAFVWSIAPQGFHFWAELYDTQFKASECV